MNYFKFKFEVISKKPEMVEGVMSYWGQITVGDFSEKFVIPLDSWTLDEYLQQWREGLEHLKNHNISCLVIAAQNLKKGEGLRI